MTSTTVSQHTTQPLNFGPEWLRALSTPDSATSIPSSSGSGGGNVFKFSAIKYRYSKDEILALRVNVSERLTEDIQNEIMNNLKDVESVFRSDILDPLALTAPTAEETAKMNALSSYISGRTPGGAGRAGNNSQQSQSDSRTNRGGGSMSNGRGGSSSRGRGGRDNNYGSNRGNNNNNNNNNSDENGENDETSVSSSSWSRSSHHSRGGSFGNRVRSYDDRDQPQTFRRGTSRQTSEGWRRSRGDDDENNNNDQNEDSSTPVNGSSSWTSRNAPARRGSSNGSMEQRTKSNDKWTFNDDRSGSSNNYESNQQRGGGWRTNSSTSDRDLNSRRPQTKRDRMPEWMDDNNDDDNQLSNATFDQDGTFTRSSSIRQNDNDEKQKTQSVSDESLSQNNPIPAKQEEEIKSKQQQPDTTVINVATAPESIISQSKPLIPTWDDDFDHNDLATTVVESTLAEDHDYSPPISVQPTPRLISMDSNPTPSSIIPQQQQRTSVIIDDKQWFYKDPQNTIQGPFSSSDMERWFNAGYFTVNLPVKRLGETQFSTIQQLTKELGCLPFRTDIPSSLPQTPVQKQQPTVINESTKFNPMAYTSTYDEYLMQQSRQSLLFNRQTSMPLSNNDRKPLTSSSSISSQLQTYFNSQPQQQQSSSSSSPLFSSNLNDPAILYQPQLQRNLSSTNQQPLNSYDDMQRSFHRLSSQSNTNSSYFPQQQQQSNDIMSRLTQAMQQRRSEPQRHDYEMEQRLKYYQQLEQTRLQQQQQQQEEEEIRKYKLQQELAQNRQSNLDQLSKTMENTKQMSMDIDPFLPFQQSIQYQKEQQAKIKAQQAENIRRYQQQYREQPQQQPMYKIPDTMNWNRQSSQNDLRQTLNFADMQEQERRSREAAAFAHQYAKSETLPNPIHSSSSSSSSLNNKTNSWARTLFADSNNGNSNIPPTSSHIMSNHVTNEKSLTESSAPSYNQQATNAVLSLLNIHPKSRSTTTNQQSIPWNNSNTSIQDIQQQQSHPTSASGWGNNFQQPSSSSFFWDNSQSSSINQNKPSTPWTELKPTSSGKINERETQELINTTRTQNALSKWIQNQFKDNSKDIDVPTLAQLLKDIDNPNEIMEYVQPYIGSVSKAKEFANDFIQKRNQLANAEPDIDNERLNEIVMGSNDNSISSSGGDEGFQIASSNGQKKKAKKMKGQKIDVKQLGFTINNRPEQRDDIDKIQ